MVAVYTGGAALMALTGASSITAATAAATLSQAMLAGAAAGFAAGVTGGLLTGASLTESLRMGVKGALFGAVSAGVANAIGGMWGASGSLGARAGRALLHGLSRAVIAKAKGGRWSAGFWSGFASSALSPLTSSASTFEGKVALSAVVGGTASELGGGKFANGAVTAAFVMMYNDMGHRYATVQTPTPAEMRGLEARFNEPGLTDVSELFVPLERLISGIGKFFSFEPQIVYRIGGNANQEYHAWRHVDDLGISRSQVASKIDALVSDVGANVTNRAYNGIITVQGTRLQVTMFKLDNGIINIGRIHEIK